MIARFLTEPGRERLGFTEAVKASFHFLEAEYGFQRVREEVTFVRYESSTVFVNVFHSRGSYEVGVEVGKRVNPEHRYRLPEMLSALAPNFSGQTWFQASSPEGVRSSVSEVARLASLFCAPIMSGEEEAFAKVDTAAKVEGERVTLQMQFGAIINRADEAWEKKELESALDLYRRAEPALDVTRRRRFEYLLKQQSSTNKS